MKTKKIILLAVLLSAILPGCFIFSSEGELLYTKGKYTIRKKNLMSYYKASPDLFVTTEKGEVKINLNGFGKTEIAQEKITGIEIKEINEDSIQIYFTATDTQLLIKNETIGVNVKYAVDSIQALK